VVRRRKRRRKAVLSVAPTFFHLLHVAIAPNPVIHLLPVSLLAAAQHRQRAARLLHHIHDAVQELHRDRVQLQQGLCAQSIGEVHQCSIWLKM